MFKKALVYVAVIGLFAAAIAFTLRLGAGLEPLPAAGAGAAAGSAAQGGGGLEALYQNLRHPLSLLLLQIVVIVGSARLMGMLFQRLGQPSVIGEMAAGIMLGPSLLGMFWPGSAAFLFPAESMRPLHLLSQVGVILFMFVVGMDLDLSMLRQRVHAAVWVSHAGIVVPFFLGTALSLVLYPSLAPAGVGFSAFALFMGTAMSITAFPVLARIIEERGLARSPLGVTAIACAAVDDVTAWCILAVVVTIVRAQALSSAAVTFLLSGAFVALLLLAVRPWLARRAERASGGEARARGLLAGILCFVFLCALATESIGIHSLFGAFLAGVALPRAGTLRDSLKSRLELFTSAFLLPLFFAFTGLRTRLGLLDDPQSWLLCLAVIGVAIGGKLGGTFLAARAAGMGAHESLALGALMNTRGLVELVVLNVGYDLGILSPRIFTMMVLMALITTFMTGPLLGLLEWRRAPAGQGGDPPGSVSLAPP